MSDSWMRRKKFMKPHASPLRRRINRIVRQLRKKYWTQVIIVRLDA